MMSGKCLCGDIQYEVLGDPVAVVVCHCINCRRQSGSAYSVNALFAQSNVSVNGTLSVFHDQGDSGAAVDRIFCGRCGSPIYTAAAAMPGHFAIKVGTLDTPDAVTPTMEIYCDRALPWLPPVPNVVRAALQPQMN